MFSYIHLPGTFISIYIIISNKSQVYLPYGLYLYILIPHVLKDYVSKLNKYRFSVMCVQRNFVTVKNMRTLVDLSSRCRITWIRTVYILSEYRIIDMEVGICKICSLFLFNSVPGTGIFNDISKYIQILFHKTVTWLKCFISIFYIFFIRAVDKLSLCIT
jgi:hypothetical protein